MKESSSTKTNYYGKILCLLLTLSIGTLPGVTSFVVVVTTTTNSPKQQLSETIRRSTLLSSPWRNIQCNDNNIMYPGTLTTTMRYTTTTRRSTTVVLSASTSTSSSSSSSADSSLPTTTSSTTTSSSSSSSVSSKSSSSSSSLPYNVEVVEGGETCPRVVDIATYRNNMVNPQMMVDRAQAKRDAIDTNMAALDGLKVGLLYVGPIIAILTYFGGSNDIMEAITNYALLGGGLGGVLAVNNFMGKSVHVPDVPEATNRIVVDFSEGVLRQQDIGFVAVIPPPPSDDSDDTSSSSSSSLSSKQEWRIFAPANGVFATVDAQLRNSEQSHSGVRKVPNLPSHLHIKNMDVHYKKRRQGVGKALMELVIQYAKDRTDAKALTLEVEGANQAAVQLYRQFGFEPQENPNWRSKNIFMVKEL